MDFLHTTSQSELGVFALGLIIAGAVSGLAAGVLGVGGGIVVVPVLYHVMAALGIGAGVRMHVAIATSLATMIPAVLGHVQNAKGKIAWPEVQRQIIPLFIGVASGCAVAAVANGNALAAIFAVVAMPVVFSLTIGKSTGNAASVSTGTIGLLFTAAGGLLSALTGITLDTARRCVFGLWKPHVDENRATFSVLALVVAAAGTLAYGIAGWRAPDLPPDSIGYVNLLGFALIAPVLLATEPAGAALAHLMDVRRLRLVFAGLIVIATGRMLWDAFS